VLQFMALLLSTSCSSIITLLAFHVLGHSVEDIHKLVLVTNIVLEKFLILVHVLNFLFLVDFLFLS
jgi:hypothetical protein